MDLLLDTHGLIWFINGDNLLPKKAVYLIKDIKNKCYVSIASIWEIAIKISLNKLILNGGFEKVAEIIDNNEFEILPISFEHITEIMSLEFHHRDPFDRIIIAQGIVENIPIITKDKFFALYPVSTIWN
jgi:PIN domain nuclease of toxin-antitoxin system